MQKVVCNGVFVWGVGSVGEQDGLEESLQINHLSHFLLCSLLIDDIKKSSDPRMIVVSCPITDHASRLTRLPTCSEFPCL